MEAYLQVVAYGKLALLLQPLVLCINRDLSSLKLSICSLVTCMATNTVQVVSECLNVLMYLSSQYPSEVIIPILQMGNRGTEILTDLTKDTQEVGGVEGP